MEQFLKWFERFEPKALVFEQVMGFQMPFIAGGSETPLSRIHGLAPAKVLQCLFGIVQFHTMHLKIHQINVSGSSLSCRDAISTVVDTTWSRSSLI